MRTSAGSVVSGHPGKSLCTVVRLVSLAVHSIAVLHCCTRQAAEPLDPQDVGLDVSAGQPSHSGRAIGVPTCRLSLWTHSVWSPGGPQVGVSLDLDSALQYRSPQQVHDEYLEKQLSAAGGALDLAEAEEPLPGIPGRSSSSAEAIGSPFQSVDHIRSTVRKPKHGQNTLTAIRGALAGNPWMPPVPDPP
jgi:hypothetical protein